MAKTKDRHSGHQTETPDVSHIHNPDVAHEESDVHVQGILWFVGGLLAFGIVTFILMWLMLRFYESRQAKLEPPPAPMALKGAERLPPEPRLQLAPGHEIHPLDDMKVLQQEWDQELNKSGLDEKTGMNKIPIKQAMQQILTDKSLAARPQAGGEMPQTGVPDMEIPTYESSGQKMEKRDQ